MTKQNHEVSTLLKLIAPEEVEVELIPLSTVEKAEFLFFWATIFLTVWGTVLGTWLSLIVVKYENQPVTYLLLAVLIFMSILVTAFSIIGFKARSSARKAARPSKGPAVPLPERMDSVIDRILAGLPEKFAEKQFKDVVNQLDNNDNDQAFQSIIFDRLIATKKATEVEEGGQVFYKKARA
jgi:hypothetical protein